MKSYFRRHVEPAFGSIPIGRLQTLDGQAWVTNLATTLSPKTVREYYRLLSAVMRSAVDSRLIFQSPCQGINLPRVAPKSSAS